MTQESRLVISVDSRKAKPNVDELSAAMRALETAGVRVTKTNTDVGSSMDRMAAQSNAAASSLKRGLVAVLGGMSVMGAIDMADEWGQYASRIKMATESTEEYQRVQSRMLESANATYRNINETREAFIQLSPVLRQMGMSLDQSMDAIDTFSGLLVTNAASADRGAAAMRALSVAFQKGKVDADQWITIYSTVDSIVDLIAKSSGKSAEEIRKLGASGQLSVKMLSQALVEGYLPTMQKVEEMPTTVRDALQNVSNAFSEYIGWNNEANGATAKLAAGIQVLGDNFSTVANAGIVLAGGALTVYAARLGISTAATIAQGVASTRAAMQQAALAASFNGTSTAAARAAVAMRALNLAMGPAGWVGLAATAAAGMYLFRDSASAAHKSLLDLNEPLDGAIQKFKALAESQRVVALNAANQEIAQSVRDLNNAVKELSLGAITDGLEEQAGWQGANAKAIREAAEAARNGSISYEELDSKLVGMVRSYAQANGTSQAWVNHQIELVGRVSESARAMEGAKGRADALSKAHDQLSGAALAAAGGVSALNSAMSFTEPGQKYLAQLQGQIKALQDGGDPIKEATRWIEDHADATDADKIAIMSAAHAKKALKDAQEAANKSMKAGASAAKELASDMKSLLDTHLPEKKALEDLFKNLEMLTKARQAGLVSAGDYDKALKSINETYAKSLESTQKQTEMERILGDLRLQQSTTQIQFMRELEAFGQGDRVRELNADLAKVEDRYRSLIEARRNSAQGLSDAELGQIRESLEKELQMVREYHDKKMELQGEWLLGAADAFNSYADNAANVYDKMGSATTSMFDGMFDAASKWAVGMDAKFGDVALSFAQMMIKMQLEAAAAPFMKQAGGWLSSLLGFGLNIGAGSVSALPGMSLNTSLGSMSNFTPTSGFSFLDTGGYTGNGGRYEPAGLVHRGEGVLNQDEIRALGGESGFNALRRAIRGQGYASGGMASRPSLPPPVGGGVALSPSLTINNNGTPQSYEVESWTREEIVLIARDEVSRNAPKAAAASLGKNNSPMRKSLEKNYKTTPRR